MPAPFRFRNPGRLVDGDLQLVLVKKTPADPVKNHSPAYTFEMRKTGKLRAIGGIRLRVGRQRSLAGFVGHIGYNVDEGYRGHHFAARSCRLLLPFAHAHGIRTLWITCDPKNHASRRTCELAGGVYINTVRVPKGTELYATGRRRVRRYRFDLVNLLANPQQG